MPVAHVLLLQFAVLVPKGTGDQVERLCAAIRRFLNVDSLKIKGQQVTKCSPIQDEQTKSRQRKAGVVLDCLKATLGANPQAWVPNVYFGGTFFDSCGKWEQSWRSKSCQNQFIID